MVALVAILEQAEADSSIEYKKYKSSDANANANRILGMEANESLFPVGRCGQSLLLEEYIFVKDGKSCHELCEHFNLTSSEPDREELKCISNRTETEYSVVYSQVCEDAKFLYFDECQQRMPSAGPYNRMQCLCGGEDDEENTQVMVCDSDYYENLEDRRPPLECASLNITDRNSCIDVATSFGKDWYCNSTSTPCTLKYQTIGNRAMCTKAWRQGSPEVICGDACAWTEEAWSRGHRIAGRLGVIGLASAIAIAIVLF